MWDAVKGINGDSYYVNNQNGYLMASLVCSIKCWDLGVFDIFIGTIYRHKHRYPEVSPSEGKWLRIRRVRDWLTSWTQHRDKTVAHACIKIFKLVFTSQNK